MSATTTCVGPESLHEYLLGRMSEAMAADVERHLACCPACHKGLLTIRAEDDFTAEFRAQAGRPQPKNAHLDRLAGDLRALLLDNLPAGREATPPADVEATPAHAGPTPENADDLHGLLAPPREPDELGRLGDYRVLKILGSGGMGVVFLAEDMRLRRRVALKAMKPALACSARARQRFLREAQLTASLTHDHVVPVHQVGEEKGVPFLAMPLLQGESLDARLKREGRLPTAEVLRIGRETAEGLAAAHERGLIHRDVKPANLWLETMPHERGASTPRYRVKVLDFGLARSGDGDAQLTQSGVILGTPAYMAPEQAGGRVDHRADLFSLGCVLYRMAAGQAPFAGETAIEILRKIATEEPRPPREVNPETPQALSDLILRLLAKDPARRPQSAHEAIDAIQAIQRTAAREVRPATEPAPSTLAAMAPNLSATTSLPASPRTAAARDGAKGRRRFAVAVMAGFVAAAAVAAVVVIRFKDKDNQPQEIKVELPQGAHDPEVVLAPKDSPVPPVAGEVGDPLSPLALVRKPAKLPGVESWSIAPIGPPAIGGWLRYVVLSPDGSQVASFTEDGVIRVWNTGGGKLACVLLGQEHCGYSASLAWSPDGQRVASHSSDGNMQIWNIVTGRAILSVHTGGGRCIAWSPGGKTLATDGGVYTLWDANTGEKIDTVQPGEGNVEGMAWSPSGKILAVHTEMAGGRKVGLWDTENGKKLQSLDGGGGLTWSHDGRVLALFQEGKIKLFDAATGALIHVIDTAQDPSDHEAGCFTKDDKTILSGNSEWDLASGKRVRALQSEGLLRLLPPDDKIKKTLSWSADRRYLAGPNKESYHHWQVWDAETGKVVWRTPEEIGGTDSWRFSPDGKSLAQSLERIEPNGGGGSLIIWDLPTARATVVGSIPYTGGVNWSPDGKHLILDCSGLSLLFETKSWQSHECTTGYGPLRSPVWSLNGKTLAGRLGDDSYLVWNIESNDSGQILKGISAREDSASLSPNGKWLAMVPTGQRVVEIWDATTGKKARSLDYQLDHVRSCAWSPDGAFLATEEYGPNRQVCIWDPHAGKRLHVLEGADGWGQNLSWSADGAIVISVDEHGTVRRWDYRTSAEVRTTKGPAGGLYSPDWKLLLANPSPAAATLWDVAGNRELAVLVNLPREQSIAISAEGHWRGTPRADQFIVYVVKTANGQEVLTPQEFADKYHWKNDPNKVQLTAK